MNIRSLYLVLIVFLSLGLLYEWTYEKKVQSIEDHLASAKSSKYFIEDGYIQIENEELVITVSVNSGSIVESRLKKHPVEKVQGSLGFRVFGTSETSSFKYYFKSGFTKVVPEYVVRDMGTDYVELFDSNLNISKKIYFSSNPYEVLVKDLSSSNVVGKSYAGLFRTDGRSLDLKRGALEGGMMNNSSYEGVAISSETSSYSSTRLNSIEEPIEVLSRSGWVAFVQKYFFAALLGSEDYVYNYYALPKESGIYRMGYTVESSVSGDGELGHEHRLFIGPKVRKDLMVRAENLELAIDMGWLWMLAQPIVYMMDFINGFIGSWGLTIIIFTILIKFAFWPLTAKSFKSMAAMRKIQPELREVQERYKNDRQKAGPETMKLMKKHGANPLGGCLPVLITMPFFIGFFFALREMVELRHGSLGVWTDLSAPDPYFILPALFAFFMVLTQRLNPQPSGMDPTQAQMMKFLPVMFSAFLLFMPAALGLYMVVNTGVQLAQQAYLYKKEGALGSVNDGS